MVRSLQLVEVRPYAEEEEEEAYIFMASLVFGVMPQFWGPAD